MMPEVYESASAKEIIKLLPYKKYLALEDLIEYIKTSDDIKKFFYDSEHQDVRYLEEAMIIVMRAKHIEYNYSLNVFKRKQGTSKKIWQNRKFDKRNAIFLWDSRI